MSETAIHSPLPKDYKRTEVGVVPKDWAIRSLGEIGIKFLNGGTPSTSIPEYWAGDIPWITGADIVNQKVAEVRRKITEQAVHNSATNVIEAGNLLVATRTGVGKLAIAPFDIAISQDLTGVYLNPDEVLTEFAFWTLDFMSDALEGLVQGTSIRGITREVLMTLKIPLPPLSEQRAIARALADADAWIEALERLIAKKRAVKQAAMQDLLTGRVRLPGFGAGVGMKRTEIGEIPEDWEIVEFGEVAKIRNIKANPARISPEMPVIELEHIGQGTGRILGYSSASQSTSMKYLFEKGDILFGRLRAYLGKYWFAQFPGACTTEIWPLTSTNGQMNNSYLFFVVQTKRFIEAASITYGTHMPRTDWQVISKLPIPLPSHEEQQAIAQVLSEMDAEIEALERERDKARAIKQGMMQELLTGRIRLT